MRLCLAIAVLEVAYTDAGWFETLRQIRNLLMVLVP
jgi:hypothetical protein